MPQSTPGAPIRGYQDLIAWQRAVDLAAECYSLARLLPAHEVHGMCTQLRRAAVSVAASIAEGHGRTSRRDYARLLCVARGSISEVETIVAIATRTSLVAARDVEGLMGLSDEVGRMLSSLIRRLSGQRLGEPGRSPA